MNVPDPNNVFSLLTRTRYEAKLDKYLVRVHNPFILQDYQVREAIPGV